MNGLGRVGSAHHSLKTAGPRGTLSGDEAERQRGRGERLHGLPLLLLHRSILPLELMEKTRSGSVIPHTQQEQSGRERDRGEGGVSLHGSVSSSAGAVCSIFTGQHFTTGATLVVKTGDMST
ncbi:unnamed protein product [Knipowitschia caucasica]|uniref:Uncharacterized protein n=1 Tax=Knipowitschia caucasica TaxID=637954 RepID=A0AAV2LMY6_KNICA